MINEKITSPLAKHPNLFQRIVAEINTEIYEEYGISFSYEKICRKLKLEDLYFLESVVASADIAKNGFQRRQDTFEFTRAKWLNSYIACEQMLNGKFKPRFYKKRTINERGKQRKIRPPHFDCKVIQKILSNLSLRPTLEHSMIWHNNASICGRGTGKLYEDVLKHINRALKRYGRDGVIVLTDFSGYFASIDREGLLKERLSKLIEDKRLVDFVISLDDGEEGLSLGNETSQIPASDFASPIDHYFKDRLALKIYNRYMDDTLAVLKSESEADRYIVLYKKQAEKHKLKLKPEKIKKIRLGESFVFCKERFVFDGKEYYRLPNPKAVRNIKHKTEIYKNLVKEEKITKGKAMSDIKGMTNSLEKHPNTRKVVKEIKDMIKDAGFAWWD